jgi:SAM-dependent methyltransferase
MSDSSFGALRIWEGSRMIAARGPAPPLLEANEKDVPSLEALAQALAGQEMLRTSNSAGDSAEPLSLEWYLKLELARHRRQGKWIPTLLEFGKHQGERLLGLDSGLGSDLVQYARCGAEVIAACPSAEQLALVRRNFEVRGLTGTFLHSSPAALPIESASIDVACLTGLLHEEASDPAVIIEEIYRVLKPGGKVLAVVPAHYDIEHWVRLFRVGPRRSTATEFPHHPHSTSLLSSSARRYRSRELRQLFHRFHESRICKRHLRRAEVPHVWRWLPLSLLERLAGRLLVFKGFKPVSAARAEQAAA